MIKSAVARTSQTELDPIDRLEEKVKRLVDLIAQMRADQAASADANARLGQEITALRGAQWLQQILLNKNMSKN